MLVWDSHGSVRSLRVGVCFHHFAHLPAFASLGVLVRRMIESFLDILRRIYSCMPLFQYRIEVRKTSVLAQYHSRSKAWGAWMYWTLAMLSWTQPDSTGLLCFRECLQEVVSVLPWFHHWVWLTQMMKGWVIPESALPSYKCVSLAPSRMVPKAHFYYRRMHWISTYGKTAFKSTSLLPHMICERGKGKLVITIDFLTYSQIIAFDYEQGQLQEWLFHLYSVCFGIRTMNDVLGCNYLSTRLLPSFNRIG